MALTPHPPREGAPIVVASVGAEPADDPRSSEPAATAAVRRFSELLDDERCRTTIYTDATALLRAVDGDDLGPECVLLDDTAQDVAPLQIAAQIDAHDPELPVVLWTSQADTYEPTAVLEAGVDSILTPARLDDDSVRETVLNDARRYRQRVADRQDASLLETMLDRLPVHVFAKDRSKQYVRASSARYDPSRLLGRTDVEIWPEREAGDRGQESFRRVLEDGETIRNEAAFCPVEDGWFLVSKVPWIDSDEIVGVAGLAIDITDRKQREEELQATTQLLSTIVQTSPAAIVVHDTTGTVQFWNPAAGELFGWTADEAIREPYPPYVSEETRDEFEAIVASVLEDGSIGPREVRRQRRDGRWLDLQLSAAALDDESGTPSRIVSVLTDVTDLKERERRLKRQNDRIEQFTRVLAHDLRNPVQVIRGQLDHGEAHDSELVERALNRIEAIVDDVLSVARSEPLVTETTSISLQAVATDVLEQRDTEAVTLTVDGDCRLAANRARLHRLLDHLFENTIEHGGDTITVGCLDDGFFVADDGPGIDSRHSEHVFEPGYSTEPTATGFGLNVVREITEAHGWTVELCETETGARFEITDVDRLDS
nr:PAS domain S-box protein [Halapricum salinum]